MTIKHSLVPALFAALCMSSTHADTYYSKYFYSNSAGFVIIKLSGYCSGSVKLPVTLQDARLETETNDSDSYFEYYVPELDSWFGSDFDTNYTGSNTTLSIQKGILKASAKTSSIEDMNGNFNDLASTNLGSAKCKENKTFAQLLDSLNTGSYFEWDSSFKHKAAFNLQGKSPFKFSYTQKSSGVLNVPQKCQITGDNTYNLATDTYKAVCKLDPAIKVSISASFKGEMVYD